jgi:pimeloyl-ACP methyl ester carboxylesterase
LEIPLSLKGRCFRFGGWLALTLSAGAFAAEQQTVQISYGDINLVADLVQEAEGNRPVAMLVHGTLAHKDMAIIETLQSALDEAGYDSLAISLSFGLSNRVGAYPCDQRHAHTQEDAIKEIDLWASWLRAQNYARFSLIGHSRGAAQVAMYAVRHPHQLDHVTLIAPPRQFKAKASLPETPGEPTAWLHDVDFLHCENATVSIASFNSYYSESVTDDLIASLGAMQVPVLLVSGSEDKVSTGLDQVSASVKNPLLAFEEIEGAGHFFHDLYAYDVVDGIALDQENRPGIARMNSLQRLTTIARESGQPIVVFVSEPDCSYCHSLRQQVLLPMIRAGALAGKAHLREVSIDTGFRILDADGAETNGAAFAEMYDVFAAPTILFLAQDGSEIAERIVGISNIEMYEHYFQQRLNKALNELGSTGQQAAGADQ